MSIYCYQRTSCWKRESERVGYCTQTEWIPSFQFKCLNLHNTDIHLSSSFMGNRHLDLSGKTHVVFFLLLFFVFLLLDRPEKIFEVKTTIYISRSRTVVVFLWECLFFSTSLRLQCVINGHCEIKHCDWSCDLSRKAKYSVPTEIPLLIFIFVKLCSPSPPVPRLLQNTRSPQRW